MNDPAVLTGAESRTTEYDRLPDSVWWAGIAMVVTGVATFVLMSAQAHHDGYLYLLLYSIPANTAISVFPHEPVLLYYGKFANIWFASIAATVGTLAAGWVDHRIFVPILNHRKLAGYKRGRFYQRARELFVRYPFATLVVTGLTPIPFWPFKFLSFSIHYPLARYLAALAIGRFPRYVALLWLGSVARIPTWILAASVVVVFATYAARALPELTRRSIPWRRQRAREACYREERA
jgi:membrane protein YqaA with SNARE-associated domain